MSRYAQSTVSWRFVSGQLLHTCRLPSTPRIPTAHILTIQRLWIKIMSTQKTLKKGSGMLPDQRHNTVWVGGHVYSYLNVILCIYVLKHCVISINTSAETWTRQSQPGELGCLPRSLYNGNSCLSHKNPCLWRNTMRFLLQNCFLNGKKSSAWNNKGVKTPIWPHKRVQHFTAGSHHFVHYVKEFSKWQSFVSRLL